MSRSPDADSAPIPAQVVPAWKKLIFTMVILLMGLLLAEGGMRLGSGEPWYLQLVEQQATHHVMLVGIEGRNVPLRSPPPSTPKQEGTFRILFLGDSFTYGAGVEDEGATFVRQIERRLNEEKPIDGIARYDVYNGGIPGSMTSQWVELFNHMIDRFQPDLVVVVFFLRDGVADVTTMGQIQAIRDELRATYDRSALFRWSRIYRFIRERQELVRLSKEYLGNLRDGYLGDDRSTSEWKRAQANLKWIRDGVRSRGGEFAVAIFPMLFELHSGYPLASACDEIESFCRREEMPVHSLLPSFLGHDAASLWVSPLDQHPNEQGHAIAAEGLYDFLKAQIANQEKP